MFCEKCGAENKDAAVFCRKCGAQIGEAAVSEAEQETRVATRRTDIPTRTEEQDGAVEAEIFSISPTLMFVKAGYVAAALGAVLLVAITSAFTSVSALWAVVMGLLLFLIPAYYHVRQKLVSYTLTESKLEIDTGFVSRTRRNVPIRRIQDVTVSSDVWQRMLGVGDVVIDNASEEGGKAVLKNINSPKEHADLLLQEMRKADK